METLANIEINRKSLTFAEKKTKAKKIIKEINNYFKEESRKEGRKEEVIIARQMAIYYIEKFLDLSNKEIAKLFPSKKTKTGYKHPATIWHAQNRIKNLLEFDLELKEYDKDLSKICVYISQLNENDLKKYLKIEDINNTLKELDKNQLLRIEKYINNYYKVA
jgi:hypothetical protein